MTDPSWQNDRILRIDMSAQTSREELFTTKTTA